MGYANRYGIGFNESAAGHFNIFAHQTAQAIGIGFDTGSYGTFSEKVTVLSSGNVGIGTTGPSSRLHVAGTNVANLLRVDSVNDAVTVGGVPNGRYLFTVGGAGDLVWTSAATVTSDTAGILVRPVSIANTSGTGDISMV